MKTAAAAGLVIGLIFLTGCAVSVDGATAPVAPASSQPSVSDDTDAAPTDDSSASAAQDELRSGSFDVTMGCPTGELVLEETGQDVLVNQDCKKITVTATQVTVVAEHVDSLILTDAAVQVEVVVRSADSVVMDAHQSEVYWEEGTPAKVQVRGVQNNAGPIADR